MICLPGQEASVSNWYPVDVTMLSALRKILHITHSSAKVQTDKCLPIRGDVFKFIKNGREQFDFIFADPPYALKELETIPELIFQNNLLKEGGLLVLEHGKDNNFEENPHFLERRVYGSVNFSLFR